MTDASHHSLTVQSEEETGELARAIAGVVQTGDIIALHGELGAGKTAFARAFIAALGGDGETPSPTFTLVQVYELPDHEVYHFDLYRLEKPEDVIELGIEDAFADGVSLIEWPERMGSYLPWTRLDIKIFNGAGDQERKIVIEDHDMMNERLDPLDLVPRSVNNDP